MWKRYSYYLFFIAWGFAPPSGGDGGGEYLKVVKMPVFSTTSPNLEILHMVTDNKWNKPVKHIELIEIEESSTENLIPFKKFIPTQIKKIVKIKKRVVKKLIIKKIKQIKKSEPESQGFVKESSIKQLIKTVLENKKKKSKKKIVFPHSPFPLKVKGFHEAAHVAPDKISKWPKPVIVVLHGTNGRPEWGCNTWKKAGGFYGWILCPRGFPMEGRDDRWTYHDYGALKAEIEASILALEKKYPNKVSRKGMVLAGFSLGAILIPRLAIMEKGKFSYLFLTEGGDYLLDYPRARILKKQGLKGIVLAVGKEHKRAKVANMVHLFKNLGANAYFLYMKGAGHHYSKDFEKTGKAALKSILIETPNTTPSF
jgi:predicted esterase